MLIVLEHHHYYHFLYTINIYLVFQEFYTEIKQNKKIFFWVEIYLLFTQIDMDRLLIGS
jgi:hypothetical protein